MTAPSRNRVRFDLALAVGASLMGIAMIALFAARLVDDIAADRVARDVVGLLLAGLIAAAMLGLGVIQFRQVRRDREFTAEQRQVSE